MNVEGLAYFEVAVNGDTLDGARNLFEEVLIQSGVGLPAPVARITFGDIDGRLSGPFALVDGAIIKLKFGPNDEEYKEIEFLVFSNDEYVQAGATKFQAFCILNKPNYLFESSFDKKKGKSVDAIKDIFGKAGIEYETDLSTDDSQMWNNCGETKRDFIKHVTTHSFVDDKSCILTVVDFDKAYTKDLFKIFDEEPLANFVFQVDAGDGEAIILNECRTSSRSGFLNATTNYGQYHQQHSLAGDVISFDKIDPVLADGAALPINTDIKGSLTNASHSIGNFFDSGSGDLPGANLHENYFKAKYQNLRYYSLFSEGLEVLSPVFLDPPLLSVYDIQHGEIRDSGPTLDEIHSGKYILVNKMLVLRGTKYGERYEFMRYFLTEEGNTPVVAGAPESAPTSSDSAQAQAQGEQVSAPTTIVPEGVEPPETPAVTTPEVPTTETGNKIPEKTDSVVDKKDKMQDQVNDNVKSNKDSVNKELADATGKAQSNFDKTAEDFDKKLDDLESDFKEEAEALGFDEEFQDKYGKKYDKLDAAMGEFQSALYKFDMCRMLNNLEALAIKAILPIAPSIVDMLNGRLDKINDTLNGMYDDIDKLIENGDIDSESLNTDKHGLDCSGEKAKLLDEAAVSDKVKPACLDDRDNERLNRSIIKLLKKEKDINEMLKDLLCSMGE